MGAPPPMARFSSTAGTMRAASPRARRTPRAPTRKTTPRATRASRRRGRRRHRRGSWGRRSAAPLGRLRPFVVIAGVASVPPKKEASGFSGHPTRRFSPLAARRPAGRSRQWTRVEPATSGTSGTPMPRLSRRPSTATKIFAPRKRGSCSSPSCVHSVDASACSTETPPGTRRRAVSRSARAASPVSVKSVPSLLDDEADVASVVSARTRCFAFLVGRA